MCASDWVPVSGTMPSESSAALHAAAGDGARMLNPIRRGGSSMVAIGNLYAIPRTLHGIEPTPGYGPHFQEVWLDA